MNSGEQDTISKLLKYVVSFIGVIVILLALAKLSINKNNDNLLENEECIATFSEKNSVIYNLVDCFNIEIQGYKIAVADKIFGYVDDLEDRNEILQKVCGSYINELNIEPENVVKIIINNKLRAIPTNVSIAKLNSNGEVAENIYDAMVVNENLLNLELEVLNNVEEVMESPCIEEESNDLYIGQESIEEGQNGIKIVYKKEYYQGVEKVKEEILDEVIEIKPTPTVIKKGVKNPYYDGIRFLSNPLDGAIITSNFGEIRNYSNHKGVDLAKDMGEEITSAFDGEVTFAAYDNGGYGNLVIIKHSNEMETYYAHLNEIKVNVGQKINKGDIIGTVGSTGYSTGPHLHFELRIGGNPVNPVNYIIGL